MKNLNRYNPNHINYLQEAYKIGLNRGLKDIELQKFTQKYALELYNRTAR